MTPKAKLVQAVLNAKKSQKPSAGMSAKAKGAAKKHGSEEAGKKVAGAIFWKKMKGRG